MSNAPLKDKLAQLATLRANEIKETILLREWVKPRNIDVVGYVHKSKSKLNKAFKN